jgi:hypothetical protein
VHTCLPEARDSLQVSAVPTNLACRQPGMMSGTAGAQLCSYGHQCLVCLDTKHLADMHRACPSLPSSCCRPAIMISYLISGVISTLTALCYAE